MQWDENEQPRRRYGYNPLIIKLKLWYDWTAPTARERRTGGEGGIRTPGTLARTPHFECGAIDHSATSPGTAAEALWRPRRRAGGPLITGVSRRQDDRPEDRVGERDRPRACRLDARFGRPSSGRLLLATPGTEIDELPSEREAFRAHSFQRSADTKVNSRRAVR